MSDDCRLSSVGSYGRTHGTTYMRSSIFDAIFGIRHTQFLDVPVPCQIACSSRFRLSPGPGCVRHDFSCSKASDVRPTSAFECTRSRSRSRQCSWARCAWPSLMARRPAWKAATAWEVHHKHAYLLWPPNVPVYKTEQSADARLVREQMFVRCPSRRESWL